MKSVYIETYGCQMNVADSETVGGLLRQRGYSLAATPDEADVILLNTCAVREHAEDRVLGRLGEMARYKHMRPGVVLGVLGCMAQHLKGRLLEQNRFVDLVAGPDSYRRLPDLLEQAANERIVDVRLDHAELYDGIEPARQDGVTAWITVQRGCDKHCTFCIVPAVRGRERCVPLEDVVREAESVAARGVREVCLLGQTVNSYHDGRHDFADLLKAVAQVPGLFRIRFTSPYPTDFNDRTIEVMATEPKIARHVHLPLQSASDRVLEKARRRYNISGFDAVLRRLREAIPGIAVSTDIIVGFHGEDEAAFRETCDYLERARFDFAFMFKYSKRSQTAAYRWKEEIDEQTKTQRLQKVIEIQERISKEIQQACVGQTAKVLVEGTSRKSGERLFGKTSEFRQVVFDAQESAGREIRPGDLVTVRIESATGHTLLGRLEEGDGHEDLHQRR
ncbi:MAG: tRNA (N6-isopentenyl adenosine(37)-C2)-methylthiotransferase MiaB [Armatimonadota bacterium]